jgi:threonine dehydrogenase-like Zn-dependent dehydrogenase
MKAARIHELGKIVVEEVPTPEPAPDEVLIRVHCTGICGTDVGVKNGLIPSRLPVTLGHEFSGTVQKLGTPGLGGFSIGDRVTARSTWPCGTCTLCRQGKSHLCRQKLDLGSTSDGSFAEFVTVNHKIVYPISPNVSFDEAQNFLNLACVVRAFKKVPAPMGKIVAVMGAGNTGLLFLQLMKLAGAHRCIMIGSRSFRLQLAERFGADQALDFRRSNPEQSILDMYPDGMDLVAEVTGNPNALVSCGKLVRDGGIILIMGIFGRPIEQLDPSFLYYKEPVVYGSKGAAGAEIEALRLLEDKRVEVTPMITHRFPLDEIGEAFRLFEVKAENALRIVIEP